MMNYLQLGLRKDCTSRELTAALAKLAPHVEGREIDELASLLESYLLSVPSALSVAVGAVRQEGCGRAVTFAAGQILEYMFDPEDLLPEQEVGVLGLLDDAYLLHTYVALLYRMYPQISHSQTYQPPDSHSMHVVRSLLPDGVSAALDRTCENLLLVAGALFGPDGRQPGPPSRSTPALRVEEGVAAMERLSA